MHFRYRPFTDTVLRVSYSRTLARPNYSDLAPFVLQDPTALTISRGNPDLKVTTSNNVDVSFEHYFQTVGVASGGFFYKKCLSDYSYQTTLQQTIGIGSLSDFPAGERRFRQRVRPGAYVRATSGFPAQGATRFWRLHQLLHLRSLECDAAAGPLHPARAGITPWQRRDLLRTAGPLGARFIQLSGSLRTCRSATQPPTTTGWITGWKSTFR